MVARILQRLRSALPPITAVDLLSIACWIGIVVGLAEGVNALILRRIEHRPTGAFTWPELLWMPPLAGVVTLSLCALGAVVADRVLRARGTLVQLAAPALVGVAIHSAVRSIYPGIHSIAALFLSVGGAAAFAQLSMTSLRRVRYAARWQFPLAVGALTLWAVGEPFARRDRERTSRAALPPAAADAPNVLLIIWDTARALSLSLYGHDRRTTPQLDEFAKGGTVFEYAFSTSSWTLPAHASMYTGREAHETGAGRRKPLDGTHETLGDALARHGYVTAGFTGNLFYGSRDFGLSRGFSWYDDEAPVTFAKIASTWGHTRRVLERWRISKANHQDIVRRTGRNVNDAFLQWVDRRGSRPFFASVNYFDAHHPYYAPPPFNVAFAPVPPRYWARPRPTDPAMLRELQVAYESSILYLDHELGRLLAALRRRGVLDNTLVVVTSDHGEQFGDHGAHLYGHQRSLYASVLRVPLVLVFPPRVPAGVRHSGVVSVRDIPATIVDALGLSDEEHFPGISLLRYATGDATAAEVAAPRLASLYPIPALENFESVDRQQHRLSLTSGTLQYLIKAGGEEELYDFVQDPWETKNLLSDITLGPALTRLRAVLDSVVPDSVRPARDTLPRVRIARPYPGAPNAARSLPR